MLFHQQLYKNVTVNLYHTNIIQAFQSNKMLNYKYGCAKQFNEGITELMTPVVRNALRLVQQTCGFKCYVKQENLIKFVVIVSPVASHKVNCTYETVQIHTMSCQMWLSIPYSTCQIFADCQNSPIFKESKVLPQRLLKFVF